MKNNIYVCHFCGGNLLPTGDFCFNEIRKLIGRCQNCNLVQALNFSDVNEDYYAADDYSYYRNMPEERKRQWKWNNKRIDKLKEVVPNISNMIALDFGCGSGGFLQQAQELFRDIIGFDLNEKVCEAHKANGWNCVNSLESIPTDIDIINLFHVLEHIPEPWKLLTDLQSRFKKANTFVIEVPNTDEALNTIFNNDSYRHKHFNFEHIWYFTSETLRLVVEKGALKVIMDTQLQRYSIANTLGWLSMDKGDFQNTWKFFNDQDLNEQYERILVSQKIADSLFFICSKSSVLIKSN